MSYQLFGIPNCETVKKAQSYLEKKKVDFEFVNFKKSPPTKEDILRWKEAFGDWPVNKKGVTYKKYKDEFEACSDSKKILFLIEQTSMIKRPILEKKSKVVAFGFLEEEYKKINF